MNAFCPAARNSAKRLSMRFSIARSFSKKVPEGTGENFNLQTSNFRENSNFKHQEIRRAHHWKTVKSGAWSFFEVWILKFEAFPLRDIRAIRGSFFQRGKDAHDQ